MRHILSIIKWRKKIITTFIQTLNKQPAHNITRGHLSTKNHFRNILQFNRFESEQEIWFIKSLIYRISSSSLPQASSIARYVARRSVLSFSSILFYIPRIEVRLISFARFSRPRQHSPHLSLSQHKVKKEMS